MQDVQVDFSLKHCFTRFLFCDHPSEEEMLKVHSWD